MILWVIFGSASSSALFMAWRRISCGRAWKSMRLSGKTTKIRTLNFEEVIGITLTNLFHLLF